MNTKKQELDEIIFFKNTKVRKTKKKKLFLTFFKNGLIRFSSQAIKDLNLKTGMFVNIGYKKENPKEIYMYVTNKYMKDSNKLTIKNPYIGYIFSKGIIENIIEKDFDIDQKRLRFEIKPLNNYNDIFILSLID